MKIFVFSDSHRALFPMEQAVEEGKPDHVIHLGDLLRDAEELAMEFPMLPICRVPGNCDGWTMEPLIRRITLGGRVILLSHGHLWRVKSGYQTAMAEARKAGAEILLFGHTHQPYCQRQEDGLWVMNPGAARSSYGVIRLDGGQVQCSLVRT